MRNQSARSVALHATVLICAALMALSGLCACSYIGSSGDADPSQTTRDNTAIEANDGEEIEVDEDQLVMKVSGAEDFAIPLDEVTVTVYDAANETGSFESAVERLKMMGIKHIKTKKPTGMDSPIVAYRSAECAPIAKLIGEDLNIRNVLEIPNDGSDGWSYTTDIAIVVA